ncbi:hypothetical protein BD309DRAFT_960423 [Dichomitus squalens]|uniref:Uncharacterized protein n=1 Tax=Dichomitus squalens TaxID=114155 RepID=A0A4Q9PVP3_9APHY|nr:hypothetical protein BD309DRAFT_960423 [Dichomitus squalens]TBU58575.1 hypothetical protein BD310DRAFT_926890 [Dichomitus squalens]
MLLQEQVLQEGIGIRHRHCADRVNLANHRAACMRQLHMKIGLSSTLQAVMGHSSGEYIVDGVGGLNLERDGLSNENSVLFLTALLLLAMYPDLCLLSDAMAQAKISFLHLTASTASSPSLSPLDDIVDSARTSTPLKPYWGLKACLLWCQHSKSYL